MKRAKTFRSNRRGAALVEYVMLLVLIGVMAITAVHSVGTKVNEIFIEVSETMSSVVSTMEESTLSDDVFASDPTPIDPLCYRPPGMTPEGNLFKVVGRIVVDMSNDGEFAWGSRGGGKSPTIRNVYRNASNEQEWYGEEYLTATKAVNGPYYWYRPTHIFPANWDPDGPGC